ncbi:MAG TPA: hypothetical protein VNM66_08045 [Thermodesulfobacteriota bacterium]|nr:hypothetical protein [Thermodesulfobacteriota bacterium]
MRTRRRPAPRGRDLIGTDKIAGGGNGRTIEASPGARGALLDSDLQAGKTSFLLEARESRLDVTGTGEVVGVKVRGFVEADFFTGEGDRFTTNSRGLRLRHAYGEATLPEGSPSSPGRAGRPS